jgi:hypothetical protein
MSASAGHSLSKSAERRGGGGEHAAIDRITVALVRKAAEDLQLLQDRTGLSKTDLVNRAITLYEFLDSQIQAGRELLVRDTETGETQIVRFF